MRIKRLNDMAIKPTRATMTSAGWDLYAAIENDVVIEPGTNKKIGTGIAIEIPDGYFGGIFARSGLSTKEGMRPANCVGVIDSDYRGEVIVAIYNDSKNVRIVSPGQKIAQMVIIEYNSDELQWTDELSDTDRGDGGFGSTGK